MKREISATRYTLWLKSITLLFFALGLLLKFVFPQKQTILLGTIFSVITYLSYYKLRKVSIDCKTLYVSNFLKEIQISFTDVSEIEYDPGGGISVAGAGADTNYIIIHLKVKTKFGKKIMFIPSTKKADVLSPREYDDHHILKELKRLANL